MNGLLTIVFTLSLFFSTSVTVPELSEIRKLYYQAAESAETSDKLSKSLKEVNGTSDPILLCYKGAAYMMEAKHAFNPLTKLSKFKKGKNIIELAIKKDPIGIELRFIRFSIQTNLPAFLDYGKNINEDKQKLLTGLNGMTDKVLKENIITYLIASKKCTKEELKKIQR